MPDHLPDRLDGYPPYASDFNEPDDDAKVLDNLRALGAYAFLGDGDWLNFATSNRLLVDEIKSAEGRE